MSLQKRWPCSVERISESIDRHSWLQRKCEWIFHTGVATTAANLNEGRLPGAAAMEVED